MTHDQAQEALREALERGQELPPAARAHTETCPGCGAFLDQLLAGERALEGAEGLSARALAHLEDRVVQGLPRPHRPWKPLAWALPLLGAVTAVALLAPRPSADGFLPRGASHAGSTAPVHLRLLCIDRDQVRADVRTDEPVSLACRTTDVLGFAASVAQDQGLRYLFVVGRTESGEPRWYHPRPEEAHSVPLPDAPAQDVPLPGVRLGINHRPGKLQVYALFSREPLAVTDVEAALRQEDVARGLPGDVLLQTVDVVLE